MLIVQFIVYDQKSKQHFAMKVENYTGRVQREIDCLKRVKYEEGFLRLKEYFTEDWNDVHLIFTLVGTTLHDLLKRVEINGKKCDLKTVLMIADQLVSEAFY
jgi:serine/threonine protein kinase